ncbi:MAG: 1-phosphofructokinase family hexose kinase [Clostridia bacterium]
MILSICINPSIDTVTSMDEFKLMEINRTDNIKKVAGGKGNNTARIIKNLGGEVSVLNMIGGYEGQFILNEFSKIDIPCIYSEIKGDNRRCLAILTKEGITELREAGPKVSQNEYKIFLDKFKEIYKQFEIITISGSLPQKMTTSAYYDLVRIVESKKIRVLVDAKSEALAKVIKAKPFMIKVNQEELVELVGKQLDIKKDYIEELQKIYKSGVEVVIVTMGEDGLLVNWQGDFYEVNVPSVKVVSTVGSGDAVLGGLAYGLANNYSVKETLKLGGSLGTAAAMSAATGQFDINNHNEIYKKVKVIKLR